MRAEGTRRRIASLIALMGAAMLGLLPLGNGEAAAQPAPPPTPLVLSAVSPSQIKLGDLLELTVDGLDKKVDKEKYDADGLRLSLDDHTLQGLAPDSIDLTTNKVRFRIVRTATDKAAWTDLLGAPPIEGVRKVSVGLTLDTTHRVASGPQAATKITLAIFAPLRLWVGGGMLAIAIAVFIWLARTTDIVRDSRPAVLQGGAKRPYSLARCQMAFWFFLVLAAFFLIWLITGDYNGIVTQQTLVLIGISAATGMSSAAIDSSKSGTAPLAPIHTTFFDDLLTDANGITLHRYQMLAWTIALGFIFVFSTYETLATPDFDANLLILMGISSGTYLGFKLPEAVVKATGA